MEDFINVLTEMKNIWRLKLYHKGISIIMLTFFNPPVHKIKNNICVCCIILVNLRKTFESLITGSSSTLYRISSKFYLVGETLIYFPLVSSDQVKANISNLEFSKLTGFPHFPKMIQCNLPIPIWPYAIH